MKSSALSVSAVLLVVVSLGCEAPPLPGGGATATATTAEATPADDRPMVAGASGEELPEIETPVTSTPRKFNSHDPIKGRRSRRAGGYLGSVGGARFYAEYQMIINNIDHALQLYNAEHGEFPKSHEEFMEKIIKFNKINLPELEPQHEYIYVPEQAEVGLQIRLKQSESSEEAASDPAATEQPAAEQPAEQPASEEAAAEQPAEEEEKEPVYNIRERAAGIGGPALDIE